MALLNRPQGTGPHYDEQGRLVGGLSGLEELAKLVSSNNESGQGSPKSDGDEDPAYGMSDHTERPKSADASSISSGSTGGVDVDDILEEVHFDDDDPIEPIKQVALGSSPVSASSSEKKPDSGDSVTEKLPNLVITEPPAPSAEDAAGPSPSSDKTVIKSRKGKAPEASSSGETSGDKLKQRFLDLNVIPRLLVRRTGPAGLYYQLTTTYRIYSSSSPSTTSSTTSFMTCCTRS